MIRTRVICFPAVLFCAVLLIAGVPVVAADNTFERTFTVSGPVHLDFSSGSGNVEIRGGADGKVHIRGKVTAGWSIFGSSEKSVQDVVANPPVEQSGDTIRVGKNTSWLKNVSIDYQIDVPQATEVDAGVASGGMTVNNVRGPLKASSASGYLHVYHIERDANVSAASGAIEVSGIGGFLRVSSASGDISISDVKGELKVNAASGSIRVEKPADRVEASSASGSITVNGASNDVKVHAISGSIEITGDPSASRFWDLKSVSGSVNLRVPHNSSFLLSAQATSGDIRTDMPVILEEQSKHSLRAHVGNSSGRIEVHTVSGAINVRSS